MLYLVKVNDEVVVYTELKWVPEVSKNDVIEVESLPEGYGILKMDAEGELYWYQPQPEPPVPVESQLTLEEMQAQTLINTEYLVTMSELSNLKGE
ncbi:hypothetical protein [Viridibacillus arvi]|uniref:hypothetical protein n=1 Tax=Viridibacillus arvi TaxID=263475 RepID=UPI003D273D00